MSNYLREKSTIKEVMSCKRSVFSKLTRKCYSNYWSMQKYKTADNLENVGSFRD